MGLYNKKFDNKRKVQVETGSKMSSEAPSPYLGAARVGLAPWGGVVPSGTVSYPFLTYNFLNFIKITNIKV